MANDPKNQAKTIMGWSPTQAPQQPAPPAQPPQPYAQPPGFTPPPVAWSAPQPPPYAGVPQPSPYPPPPAYPPAPQPYQQAPYPPPQPPQPYAQPPQHAPYGQPPPPYGQPPQHAPYPPAPQPYPQQAWGPPPGVPSASHGWGPPPAEHGHARPIPGADATHGVSARLRFIRLTYLHLFGAILAFAGIEWLLFTNDTLVAKVSAPLVKFALGGRANWAAVLVIFMAVSMLTHWLAEHSRSRPLHYVGLGLYVIAEALIFVPLLAIVQWKSAEIVARGGGEPNIIRDAAFITLGVFGALTLSVFVTKKDFSFLRTALAIAGAASLGLIALSLIFGFNLGIVFAIAMVLLAAGQILYETSQVMAHDDPESYVGAALSLFASVALMFWYVIRIIMKLRE